MHSLAPFVAGLLLSLVAALSPRAVYSISIRNERGRDGDYAVFLQPPDVSISSDIFTTAWMSSFIYAGGSFDTETVSDWFAWSGKLPHAPAPDVKVAGGIARLAELGGSSPGSTFEARVVSDVATLTAITPAAPAGSFQIVTGTDLPTPNEKFIVGVGMNNNYGRATPVAVMLAQQNKSMNISPKMVFYVCRTAFTSGEIINFSSISGACGVVDFTNGEGLGKTGAVVTHGENGQWVIQY